MKDYIAERFPENMTYDQLRAVVKEAWDAISDSYLMEQLDSMDERCQTVIDANGMHIRF